MGRETLLRRRQLLPVAIDKAQVFFHRFHRHDAPVLERKVDGLFKPGGRKHFPILRVTAGISGQVRPFQSAKSTANPQPGTIERALQRPEIQQIQQAGEGKTVRMVLETASIGGKATAGPVL